MNERRKSRFRRLIFAALNVASASARPYTDDIYQGGVQQSMDSMTPVERFLYNQNVVHTFDNVDACSRKCPRQCLVQEVADLMMPRYVCPAKGTLSSELTPLSTSIRDNRALSNDDILPFSSQYLLILVPLSFLIIVVFLIVWCRKCSNNNSSLD